ncbi:MAG: M23 family metallopeptidase [Acidobacteriota bacterium]
MKKLILSLIVIALIGYLYLDWDGSEPTVEWLDAPQEVGAKTAVSFQASDAGKGLARITVTLAQGGQRQVVFEERMARSWQPWQEGTPQRAVAFQPVDALRGFPLAEQAFQMEVEVEDHPSWLFFSRTSILRGDFRYDATPPSISLQSTRHNIRQGGAEAVVYSVSDDTADSGVLVAELTYRGFEMARLGSGRRICLLALPYNAGLDTAFKLWAVDAAGNRSETPLAVQVRSRRFRRDTVRIQDSFIDKVAPEILQRSNLTRPATHLETFLLINRDLRRRNHIQIEEISRRSASDLLWNQAFAQMRNSAVQSSFADERTYLYQGQEIDQQTHLGFDLASTAASPVEAANGGKVAFVGYLGIYGNCVILDHGLGLMSLYAHLSEISVALSQQVRRGEPLGRTGETGLAGGDHLHFTMLVQGLPVNPLEWWDPAWVRNHVLGRLE